MNTNNDTTVDSLGRTALNRHHVDCLWHCCCCTSHFACVCYGPLLCSQQSQLFCLSAGVCIRASGICGWSQVYLSGENSYKRSSFPAALIRFFVQDGFSIGKCSAGGLCGCLFLNILPSLYLCWKYSRSQSTASILKSALRQVQSKYPDLFLRH